MGIHVDFCLLCYLMDGWKERQKDGRMETKTKTKMDRTRVREIKKDNEIWKDFISG